MTDPEDAEEERVEMKLRIVHTTAEVYVVTDGDTTAHLKRKDVGYDGEFFYIPISLAKATGLHK